ncbi:MAG: DUF4215 domain-containing protein [Deltaproteobacteria bacterium]|nr:DUF4215 domain-containing protein [Deltaproteobacteria bacterium]
MFGTVYGDVGAIEDVCGDGLVTGEEACDPEGEPTCGDGQECVDCACLDVACGDGRVSSGEECDPLSDLITCSDGTFCTSDCSCVAPTCGNGTTEPGEECDDGNGINGDSCENDCTLPVCGNAITDAGEECDDGNAVNGDACDINCTTPRCGNGALDPLEQCDDGNTISGDGCENSCRTTGICGNEVVEPGEECDDGNLAPRDGCSSLCTIELCGNEMIDAGEECDDGNTVSGDGCSSACLIEVVSGVDFVTAGFGGMRGIGSGTLTVAGVTGAVTRAILYWQGPTNLSDSTANAGITFANQSIMGTNIGFSSDNCWGFQNSQAYRADVTGLVTGDGAYSIGDLLKPGADINGASLIVFFNDGDPSNDMTVHLFDGNDSTVNSVFDAAGWNQTYPDIAYPGGTANMILHVADGQTFSDGAVSVNGSVIAAAGAVWSGNTVPNGASASSTNGGLWDIRAFDIASIVSVGSNDLNLVSPSGGDCLGLIVTMIVIGPAPL